MGNPLTITILAVTKTYESYCIAGMDANGKWYRPLPELGGKFWSDLRYGDGAFIQVGDVWEVNNYISENDLTSPGHTEDIRLKSSVTRVKSLNNQQLIQFVQRNQENKIQLQRTLNANDRSLCLVHVEYFEGFVHTYNERRSARVKFKYNGEIYHNTTSFPGFPLTDLKWRSYILKEKDTPRIWRSVFICIGLARREPAKNLNKEFPMVISIITDPEVPLLSSYPY